jgi:hypothetical protein
MLSPRTATSKSPAEAARHQPRSISYPDAAPSALRVGPIDSSAPISTRALPYSIQHMPAQYILNV